MQNTRNQQKTPVRIVREFFCYSAYFTNLAANVPQTHKVNILGDSAFELKRIGCCFSSILATPTTYDKYLMPDVDVHIMEVGTDRGFYFEDTFNVMDLIAPEGGYLYDMACPVVIPARSQLVVTVTSAYVTTLPMLSFTFMGARMFKTLPPPPPKPILVQTVTA